MSVFNLYELVVLNDFEIKGIREEDLSSYYALDTCILVFFSREHSANLEKSAKTST